MKSSNLVAAVLLAALATTEPAYGFERDGQTAFIDTMSWYHLLMEPGVSEITLLCTVVGCEKGPIRYESQFWSVRLRIDERIHVAENFEKRLENARFVVSEDYTPRKIGERIIYFAGIGESYEGEDFLKPAWSGTSTHLGIELRDGSRSGRAASERLLATLRAEAKGAPIDAGALEVFAVFCPKGVAHYRERERNLRELRREWRKEAGNEGK